MKCEIRNNTSSENFTVPPEGSVFGRQGGPANITVADQSVSKRHARIYMDGGRWYLEDLKSVNGTVVNSRRITEPVALTPGFQFSLSKHQFEILSIEGDKPARGRASAPQAQQPQMEPMSDGRRDRAKGSGGVPRGRQQPIADMEPMLPPADQSNLSMKPSSSAASRANNNNNNDDNNQYDYNDDQGSNDEPVGAGAAIASAFGYYLKNVPLMVLNPIGTVRAGVDNPQLPYMTGMPLAFFLTPVLVGGMAVQQAGAGIGAFIGGGGGFGAIVVPLVIGVVVGAISAVIQGFIGHPITKFVVERIFKGETDEKTRTNSTVMGTTALAIVFMVTGGALVMSGVIARLTSLTRFAAVLQIVPALMSLVTMPLVLFISYSWLKAWRTAKWAQTLMLALAGLALLFGGLGLVTTGKGIFDTIRGGGGVAITDVAGMSPEDVKKATEDAIKKAQAGVDAKDPTDPKIDPDAKDPKVDAKDPKVDAKDPKVDAKVDPPPSETPSTSAAGVVARRRDAITKTLATDPSFLVSKPATLDKYKEYQRCAYAQREDARERLREGVGKKRLIPDEFKDGTMLGDLINALVITKCSKQIEDLHAALPKAQ